MTRMIRVGTRKSKLALTQTKWFVKQLESLKLPYRFELKEIVTTGDEILDVTLSKVGGKGLFVKEIEKALLDEEIDLAVHSMKDVPAHLPEGLIIGCNPKRVDARDCLISRNQETLDTLAEGAVIGTSSLRRASLIRQVRPDVEVKWIRGNIDTRLNKLKDGEYDAILLAGAGLTRMGWTEAVVSQWLPVDPFIPAVGQGALGIECRQRNLEIMELLQQLHHTETGRAVETERAFLDRIEGSCQVPVGAYARVEGEQIHLLAMVGSPDGTHIIKEQMSGTDARTLGERLADKLLELGGRDILAQVLSNGTSG